MTTIQTEGSLLFIHKDSEDDFCLLIEMKGKLQKKARTETWRWIFSRRMEAGRTPGGSRSVLWESVLRPTQHLVISTGRVETKQPDWKWKWKSPSHDRLFQPHESQHARPPCPSPTPGVYSNSCPFSLWCHHMIAKPNLSWNYLVTEVVITVLQEIFWATPLGYTPGQMVALHGPGLFWGGFGPGTWHSK